MLPKAGGSGLWLIQCWGLAGSLAWSFSYVSLGPVTAPVTKPKPAEDAFSVLCPFDTEQCEPVNKNKGDTAFQCWDLMNLVDCCETAPGVLGAEEGESYF